MRTSYQPRRPLLCKILPPFPLPPFRHPTLYPQSSQRRRRSTNQSHRKFGQSSQTFPINFVSFETSLATRSKTCRNSILVPHPSSRPSDIHSKIKPSSTRMIPAISCGQKNKTLCTTLFEVMKLASHGTKTNEETFEQISSPLLSSPLFCISPRSNETFQFHLASSKMSAQSSSGRSKQVFMNPQTLHIIPDGFVS